MSDLLEAQIPLLILAFLTLSGAVLAMQLERVIHIMISLAFTMLGIAGIYVLLNATLLAVIQILLYGGAVSILMLFAIMLTRHHVEDRVITPWSWPPFLATAGCFAAFTFLLYRSFMPDAVEGGKEASVQEIGVLLFRSYALPLEALSVILLVAAVGAIALTQKKEV